MLTVNPSTVNNFGRSKLARARDQRGNRGNFLGSPESVIAAMGVIDATGALFLDICHLAVRGNLTIFARHASTRECRKADQPNETHHGTALRAFPALSPSNLCTAQFDDTAYDFVQEFPDRE